MLKNNESLREKEGKPGIGGSGEAETSIIMAQNISKAFPGVQALDNVSYDIRRGEVHGLLGQNGAGKSTLLKILYGIYRPDSGKIFFEGREVLLRSPREARSMGIALVHQEITLLPDLSVLENIALLGPMWRRWASRFVPEDLEDSVKDLLGELGSDIDLAVKVKKLTVAEKMIVQMSAALALNAKVILLDEPTSPMTPVEIEKLLEAIKKLRARGVGLAFVTHRVGEAIGICDRISVLRNGQKVATLRPSETSIQDLARLMLGREFSEVYIVRKQEWKNPQKIVQDPAKPLLEMKNVYTSSRGSLEAPLRNVNLKIYRGEVIGVVGLLGSGKKELGRTLIGLSRMERGEIYYEGKRVKITSPRYALRLGIAYIPEDRRYEGLVPDFSVAHNMDLSSLSKISRAGFLIDLAKEAQGAVKMIKSLGIVAPSPFAKVTKLSGGNQQKVLISRAILSEAKLVIFDEPTIGIDIGSKMEIRKLIYNHSREKGVSALVLTSDVDEALGLADRIYVIREGSIVSEHINDEHLSRDEILERLVGLKPAR